MTKYEKLLLEAERIGIKVKEVDLGFYDECGYYSNNKIIINSRMTDTQKYGVLAEELGHHFKTAGDITDQSKIENRKQELIARRKGYKFILQPIDLIHAFRLGYYTQQDIADFYGITPKKLLEIIEDFKKQYGVGKRFDRYFVMFEPRLGFIEIKDTSILINE
ncbi:ImmA/IrrE family metallo-endopeptidase [Clostridium butyricum]|uniref:IrrE N-terminal-like domain-containing protein n=1 Tax=Clostridium butyricum TaxID=1492 RepID=A0A6N3BCW9_CLOBU|nr:ImmA/IrrE family metallo-endopeptidase [Clostridium butyricum]